MECEEIIEEISEEEGLEKGLKKWGEAIARFDVESKKIEEDD
jgi:hypothetical protein